MRQPNEVGTNGAPNQPRTWDSHSLVDESMEFDGGTEVGRIRQP